MISQSTLEAERTIEQQPKPLLDIALFRSCCEPDHAVVTLEPLLDLIQAFATQVKPAGLE